MNPEEFSALMEMPGWKPISYTAIRDVRDSCNTEAEKIPALAKLFFDYGLDLKRPVRVAKCEDNRMYGFRQSDDGQMVTPADFDES